MEMFLADRLVKAVRTGDLEEIKQIMIDGKHGKVDVDVGIACLGILNDDRMTTLQIAANYGELPIVQWLVEQGAYINKTHAGDRTSLHIAVKAGHLEVVQYLVQRGADKGMVGDNTSSPLYCAAEFGLLKVVRYLVEQGAAMNKTRYSGRTPLYVAAQQGQPLGGGTVPGATRG